MDWRGIFPRALVRNILTVVFSRMSFILPFERLRESDFLVAFYHPRPAYPVHVLFLPKKAIASLVELDASDDEFLIELFTCDKELVAELDLEGRGYRLIVNGGTYQKFPYLHFHLVSGEEFSANNI